MNNVMAILRRDFGAYFTSPIGYIFMMVFVTISVGLYITSFFSFPVADMRPYFDNLPLLLCVFIPAVTMRIWAEERKENTWEMLLTFPMQAWELVAGKFLAALLFFAVTLFSTVTVPLMLLSLGTPDLGAIFGGYLGTVLLGAFFLALGILFSGFFKDQIVAFAVTLLTCFSLFLVGTQFIASYIDDRIAGVGSALSELLGFISHYGAFTRGVVDFASVIYFIVWIAVFLVLNVLFIDGRNRPGARTIFAAACALSLVIGLLFNYVMSGSSLFRVDLTQDKIYTISKASKAILSELETPVQVKVYITPKDSMPTGMKELEQDITDKLEEMRIGSDGKVDYTTVYLEVANVIADPATPGEEKQDENEEEAIETRMLDKGVEPFNVRAMSQDEVTNKLVYSSIGIAYKDKAEEIIPQVVPQTIQELEYKVVSSVYKLTREEKPVVALVAPKEAVSIDPQMRQILMQMGQPVPESDDPYVYLEQILDVEKYEVQRVDLTKESPLPEKYDTLVVVNPRALNERQRWEIGRALHGGANVVLAVQQYEWDYRATRNGNTVSRRDEDPAINELLESYGLGVSDEILMDVNQVPLTIQGGGGSLQDMLQGGQPFKLPMHILVNNSSMDQEKSITSRLSNVFYLWGTGLEIQEEKLKELGLTADVIMTSSERAWTVSGDAAMTAASFQEPAETDREIVPLMAMIEGQFPDAFAGKERPEWPKSEQQPNQFGQPPAPENDAPEAPATPVEAKPGKLILMGCSEMFRKNFLQADNLDLFLNCVDAVTLNENLVNVRGRKPIDRTITRPSDNQKTVWRMANYGLANIIIASIGVGLFAARRRARNAYTMSHVMDD
ncbi:MAG: Gldg family protein [Candidatus Hydrogenedentes bacterium]|nr:Gldg family protein [Candidatus Hydrogenedentota bacterium]